ncbi:MAG: OmpA family protein [Pelatocladus maniniholoensis HA4357-MV3]|jgi:outer membrane protein OmpA-like peptidoglycan-associated protein|uniref:OmpA family protein n=1 Tax=Pelatocladus maniniholoensis HA4357-MV3 TaxID=1117104 RepID=A0A9E3LSJ7_9NOST|nr:OmpA family protein [Pelatocladus maniniholoensis HA4357-MV3]
MSKLKERRQKAKGIIYLLPLTVYLLPPEVAFAQTPTPAVRVVVNSSQDGSPTPDNAVTLREAIAIVNGTLPTAKLSAAEKAQVTPTTGGGSRIEFNLPAATTTIELQTQLPDLATPGLVIDGSTQPGYDSQGSATAEIAIPVPVVAITPAANKEILRGLTVVADGVTIRGLSIYGFTGKPIKQILGNLAFDTDPKPVTLTTPPGDIVIAHRFPPPDISRQKPPNDSFPFRASDVPPKNVVIENNWLGLTTNEQMPEQTSAFGVYVFNSQGTTIRRNRIYYHDGSAVITSVRGENTVVQENILVANGIAGMPDALRFEGLVNKSQILGNLICGNDGAGVYLFKPQGGVTIQNNKITYNGRRLRRSAIYLMGSNHQVVGNEIDYQAGPGVVVSAFPRNDVGQRKPGVKNIIQNNKFAALEGLSIDLNTEQNLDVSDFQVGDGPNPRRDSPNRRLETGNGAINAPEFKQRAFPPTANNVTLQGKADRGSQVTIYRLGDYQRGYGALSQPLATVPVDQSGNFSATVENLQTGDVVSAIATDPQYGTSEPALAAIIGTDGTKPNLQPSSIPNQPPQCTSRPVPPPPPEPPAPPPPPPEPPETIRIQAPNNVHFALDKSFISAESAAVLDRVAVVLQKYPFIVVELEGHTDPRASNAYNLALGKRRALAVRNYLLRKGITPERMTIRSFGETQRKTEGNSRVDYARDRRTEIIYKDVRGIELIVEPQEQDLQIESPR